MAPMAEARALVPVMDRIRVKAQPVTTLRAGSNCVISITKENGESRASPPRHTSHPTPTKKGAGRSRRPTYHQMEVWYLLLVLALTIPILALTIPILATAALGLGLRYVLVCPVKNDVH